MHNCHHHIAEATSTSLFGIDGLGIIITLFLTGLTSSFTHCIGMCGPFAVAQTSMRLMKTSSKKMSQKARLDAALLLPYYFGKAVTYSLLLILGYLISENFREFAAYKYFALFFLISTALLFLKIAITRDFTFIKIPKIDKLLSNKINLINTRGIKGVITGMILGLIPCGLVYGAIIAALSATNNLLIAIAAIIAFGIATVPGLFITSYFGQFILNKYRKVFNYIFSFIMILNALFLLGYALKLL